MYLHGSHLSEFLAFMSIQVFASIYICPGCEVRLLLYIHFYPNSAMAADICYTSTIQSISWFEFITQSWKPLRL